MADVLATQVDVCLVNHPAVRANPTWKRLASVAVARCISFTRLSAGRTYKNERYGFDIHIDGLPIDPIDPAADALYEAGCDDAIVGTRAGQMILGFTREASSFAEAVVSAMRDIERAGGRILRVERIDD